MMSLRVYPSVLGHAGAQEWRVPHPQALLVSGWDAVQHGILVPQPRIEPMPLALES